MAPNEALSPNRGFFERFSPYRLVVAEMQEKGLRVKAERSESEGFSLYTQAFLLLCFFFKAIRVKF